MVSFTPPSSVNEAEVNIAGFTSIQTLHSWLWSTSQSCWVNKRLFCTRKPLLAYAMRISLAATGLPLNYVAAMEG